MKLKTRQQLNLHKTDETIGFFQSTQLVRRFDGLHELRGGTKKDRSTIRRWCGLCAPDIIFADELTFLFPPTGL